MTEGDLIRRLGYVSIGKAGLSWYASGFAKSSNADHRGYGSTVMGALCDLAAKIDATEHPKPPTIEPTVGLVCPTCNQWFPGLPHQCLGWMRK